MSNKFLTSENANHVINILKQFFKDKHNYDLNTVINEEFKSLLTTKMITINKNNPNEQNIQSMNLKLMTDLKKLIELNYISDKTSRTISSSNETVTTKNVEINNTDDDNPEDFAKKIQELELRRKNFVPPPKESNVEQIPKEKSNAGKNIEITEKVSTIYMPTPPKIGREFYIHSYDRNWIYDRPRSSFSWNKQLPKMQDMMCRVACWIGSKNILMKAPCLVLEVKGANGDVQKVSMIPISTNNYFAIYRPPLDSLGYLKLISLPWKITLKTGDNENIDIGEDGDYYEKFEKHPYFEDRTILYIENTKNYMLDHSIRIITETDVKINAKVINVNNTSIEINKCITEKGYIMNFSEQFSILLELTSKE